MTLNEIINLHNVLVNSEELSFPKPLPKNILTSIHPQLKLVGKPKVQQEYFAEDYLAERLEEFFDYLLYRSDIR